MEEEPAKEDVDSEEGRENALEDDEISPAEEGFLEGASGDGQGANCRKCGKVLVGDDFIERKAGKQEEILRFCSDECCDAFFVKAESRENK